MKDLKSNFHHSPSPFYKGIFHNMRAEHTGCSNKSFLLAVNHVENSLTVFGINGHSTFRNSDSSGETPETQGSKHGEAGKKYPKMYL